MTVANRLARLLASEWDATEQPIEQRGNVLPLGIYDDGSVHMAWPGIINDGIEGFNALWDRAAIDREGLAGTFDPELGKEAAGGSLMASGLAATGGLAAGAVPENALARSVIDTPPSFGDIRYSLPDHPDSGVWLHGTHNGNFDQFALDANANNGWGGVSMTKSPGEAFEFASLDGAVFPLRETTRNRYQLYADDFPLTGRRELGDRLRAQGYDGLDVIMDGQVVERAALRPGTVFSATTGEQLFSNPRTAPLVPAAVNALERTGTDLPMDLASRMARAKEMGFDTDNVLYHGTRNPSFDAFDTTHYGSNMPWSRQGVHLSPSPKEAGTYAGIYDGGAIYNTYIRPGKQAVIDQDWLMGADVGPFHRKLQDLKDQGFDSALAGTEHIVFDPRNIRSVNAAFDPAKADSANLFAANPWSASFPLLMDEER